MRLILLLSVLCLTASCIHRVSATPPFVEAHPTFSIQRINEDRVLVAATGAKGDADAKAYVCPKGWICTIEPLQIHVYILERHRK